jgi:hypothetical protein
VSGDTTVWDKNGNQSQDDPIMSDPPPERPLTNASTAASFDAGEDAAEAIRTLVSETADAAAGAERFDIGVIFRALSEPGRRYVLTYLLRSEGFVACSELVDYVVEQTDSGMTDGEFRRRVVTELTHSHLPKLEECGLVRYNMERQIVSSTELTPVVWPYLRLALQHQTLATGDD